MSRSNASSALSISLASRIGEVACKATMRLNGPSRAVDLIQRVQPGGLRGGQIARDIVGTAHADRAGGFRGRQDGIAVGRHRDDIDAAGGSGLHHRPGDQRLAAEIDQVLVRNSLGTAARRDHRQRSSGCLAAHIASLETLERGPETFAHVLVALPDLGNERGPRRVLAQHGADLVEVDLAVADLQAFAVEALGVAEMQMRRMRAELRQSLAKSKPK